MAYNDRRRIARLFDNEKELVSTRSQLVAGQQLSGGDDVPEDLPHATRLKLWMSGRFAYKSDWSPTPIAGPVPSEQEIESEKAWMHRANGVEVIEGEGEIYRIDADWLDEVVIEHGAEAAKAKAEEMRESDEFSRNGVSIDHKGGGYYEISAEWLDEPAEARGKDEAEAEARKIIEARAEETAESGAEAAADGDSEDDEADDASEADEGAEGGENGAE